MFENCLICPQYLYFSNINKRGGEVNEVSLLERRKTSFEVQSERENLVSPSDSSITTHNSVICNTAHHSNIYDSTQEENFNSEITPDSHIIRDVNLTNTSTDNTIAASKDDPQIALNKKDGWVNFWPFNCKLY